MMLKALGKKLLLRPALPHTMSDGGIHLVNQSNDDCADRIYHVVSIGPDVKIEGLQWGTRVLISGHTGVGFTWENYPLRLVHEDEVLMILPGILDPVPPGAEDIAPAQFRTAPGTVAIGHPEVEYPPPQAT